MPTARLVDPPVARRRTDRRAAALAEERWQIRELLTQAGASEQAIELTLAPDERDETVKLRYRGVARDMGYGIQFQTGRQRSYLNRKGKEEREAEVLLVHVTPPVVAPPARPARRRRAAGGA